MIELIDGGATAPFIARYRKEATGGLDDTQLRHLDERVDALRDLEKRRETVVKEIDGQGKLTPELRAKIMLAETSQRLEDLYLPFKVKRRTNAEIEGEAGLEVLADLLLGNSTLVPEESAAAFLRERFTSEEGEKPGRDPRPEFRTATFKAGVNEVKDLEVDMVLEGVVTNVTNFGAFVDVGVHQDGLVHNSAMADRFVKDPHEIAKASDVVRVRVMEVDVPRKRIGLSMRLADPVEQREKQTGNDGKRDSGHLRSATSVNNAPALTTPGSPRRVISIEVP